VISRSAQTPPEIAPRHLSAVVVLVGSLVLVGCKTKEKTPIEQEQLQAVSTESAICSNCNKTDSNGRKQGLWVEEMVIYRFEWYYDVGARFIAPDCR
jgi:hypothetical protein